MNIDWSQFTPTFNAMKNPEATIRDKIQADLPDLEFDWESYTEDGSFYTLRRSPDWRIVTHFNEANPNAVVFCMSPKKLPSSDEWQQGKEGYYKTFTAYDAEHTSGARVVDQEEAERKEQERQQQKAEKAEKAAAARQEKKETLADRYNSLPVFEGSNDYTERKHITITPEMGIKKVRGGYLFVPLYDAKRNLLDAQTIYPDGSKKYEKGLSPSGGYFPIGFPNTDDDRAFFDTPCFLSEGLATAVSIWEATGVPVVSCCNCNNLSHVAPLFKNAYGIADNDEPVKGGTMGVGELHMKEALGDNYVLMKRWTEEGDTKSKSDANDFACKYGLEALRSYIEEARRKKEQEKAEQEQRRARLESYDLPEGFALDPDEWLNPEANPMDWIVDELILASDEVGAFYGRPSEGKTTLLCDLLFNLAIGSETWAARETRGVCRSLYFASEGVDQIRNCRFAFANDKLLDAEHTEMLKRNFIIDDKLFNVADDQVRERLVNSINRMRVKPTFIVFDTLNGFMQGMDENNQKDATMTMEAMKDIHRRTGAVVLYVSHVAKQETEQGKAATVRGSSVFGGSNYLEVNVTETSPGKVEALVTKRKGAPRNWAMNFSRKIVNTGIYDTKGRETTGVVYEFESRLASSLASFKKKEKPKTPNQIAKENEDYNVLMSIFEKVYKEKTKNDEYFIDLETFIANSLDGEGSYREQRNRARNVWSMADRTLMSRLKNRGYLKEHNGDNGKIDGAFVQIYEMSPCYWEAKEIEAEEKEKEQNPDLF